MPSEDGKLPAPAQTWNAERYARHAGYVVEHGAPVVDLLAPMAGERILDLGCGDGRLTVRLLESGADVFGIDASPGQVHAARARGINAKTVDATALNINAEFDAVFSNAVLHWVSDIDTVIGGVFRALRPGGRFVGEMGGQGNVETIIAAITNALRERGIDPAPLNPWYFPDTAAFKRLLAGHGFRIDYLELIPRWTALDTSLSGWMDTFAESYLSVLALADRPAFVAEIEAALAPQFRDTEGGWHADYVRLRFKAAKEKGAK